MKFGEYLEYFGWSQAEFARRVKVSPDTVSRWRGEPPEIYLLYLNALWHHAEYTKGLKEWWYRRDVG